MPMLLKWRALRAVLCPEAHGRVPLRGGITAGDELPNFSSQARLNM